MDISIKGTLLNTENKKPIEGFIVEVWVEKNLYDKPLTSVVTNSEGNFVIKVKETDLLKLLFSSKPRLVFKVYSRTTLIKSTENEVYWSFDTPDQKVVIAVDPRIADGMDADVSYVVTGRVVDTNGVVLDKLIVEAFAKTLDKAIPLDKTQTDNAGNYLVKFSSPEGIVSPDIQLSVYPKGDKKNATLSAIKYNATEKETIDVVVKAELVTKPSEFSAILHDIQSNIGSLKLTDLKEDTENQHITYLSNKTGWDSRMTAMLAASQQLGSEMKLDPGHVYALLRAGVPATQEGLKAAPISKVEKVIKNAVEKNIIPIGVGVGETVKNLTQQALSYVLDSKHFASVSSMNDMLSLRLNTDQKTIFAQTVKELGNNNVKLWDNLRQKGFPSDTITKLKLDGKLGYLTGNNAPVIQKIYSSFSIKSDIDLVANGLYKETGWNPLIGNDFPTGITAEEYARHLANQVKMSFPTAIAGEIIKRGEIELGANVPVNEVADFFKTSQVKYNLGTQPLKAWEGFSNLSTLAKAAAKTYERLYQISPSDEAMIAMSKIGMNSAFQIARLSKNEFMAAHGKDFPSSEQAALTYTKANEVYSASLGVATTYITNRQMPNVYALTGEIEKTQAQTIAYPTLEWLFGNMEYCACDHCKSVLSPAAYLVELLQFIDISGVPHAKSNPIDVLLTRRPDIQHIQLSCENTNLALPYIDLVNEVLEHYILNGNLINLTGHDSTTENTQAELLAEPQFVESASYDLLKTKVFPYNLPFHQPLETLRLLFKTWDISLGNALEVFSTPVSSRKEALMLNTAEYRALTEIAFKPLPEYFGELPTHTLAQLNTAIANGKTFSRRVGLDYEELVLLLKTNFINQGHKLVPSLMRLKVGLPTLQDFYLGTLTDAQMDAVLPTEIDAADFGGNVKQWLRDNRTLIMGMITLTDLSPENTECSFADVELRFAVPDNNANRLTALVYHKFHRFLRIRQKTEWSIETLDQILKIALPIPAESITEANIDSTFVTVLDRMANFKKLADHLSYSVKKYPALFSILDSTMVSTVRQAELARIVKISTPELLELSVITGIDPFANDLESPSPSLLRFIKLAQNIKNQSIKISDLAYLLHHVDLTGKWTPSNELLLKNVKILHDTLVTIEKENSIAPDNADFNFAKSKMLMVYDAAVTEEFFGLLMGTKTFSAPFLTVEENLTSPKLAIDPHLGFDAFKKELNHSGILSDAAKVALENAADGLTIADMGVITTQAILGTFITDFKTALGALSVGSNEGLTTFSQNYPELKVIYDAVKAEITSANQAQKLVSLILPELINKLRISALQQALNGILKTDADTVSVLTSRKEIVKATGDAAKPVLFDFTQLLQKVVFGQNITHRFYIDVPISDDYLLYLSAAQNTSVTLIVDGQTVINNVTIGASKEVSNTAPLKMKADGIKFVEMTISGLPAGENATLLWKTKGMAKVVVPDSAMYSSDIVDLAKTSLTKLSKASQLQTLFKFTTTELDYFAAENSETKDFLNGLDSDGSISPANLNALWKKIELLLFFNTIKKENEPEENTWVQVLKNPSIVNAQGKLLIEGLNLWLETDISAVLSHLAINRADLSKISNLKKLMEAMQVVTSVGYPASSVIAWVTNDPSYSLVSTIKTTVKQQVSEASWLETMQSVNNPVRNLLRDALVSYILHYKKPSPEINTSDKLYEYFLIDVEMDACMKTSRIRQALSTVQLFIMRCLINLEPDVAPSSIRAEQWAWMKRYRVWEANRKVFLYPENWLEPELRDNKSSLFKELEGELLQGEVTDESAELAFLNYLKKLDDIAKLEIVGMYLEENEQNNQDDDILHVFARTNGNTRQYYYRRYEYGYWTPWEKMSLNVEGDHLFPIVWRKRLFVFWLNIFEKPTPVTGTKSAQGIKDDPLTANSMKNVEVNMCWGEYYKGKWTSPKSTDLKRPVLLKNLTTFDSKNLFVYGRTEKVEGPIGKFRERVIFNIHYGEISHGYKEGDMNGYFLMGYGGKLTFTSKNAAPSFESAHDKPLIEKIHDLNYTLFQMPFETNKAMSLNSNNVLLPGKTFKVLVPQPLAPQENLSETILTKKDILTNSFNLLSLRHPVENQFEAPLSYADENSTFFIKPEEEVFIPLQSYNQYYPIYEVPILTEIPILVENPIFGWPPEEIINWGGDRVSNPWEWGREAIQMNSNINKMLPTTQTFLFGETEFGMPGKNQNINIR